VVVAQAVPGGPADEAGIMAGDSIVECDGKRVTSPSALLPLLAPGEKRRQVHLTVLRPVTDSDGAPESKEDNAESA
jgi:S1-C subfamily serine protease